MTCLSRNAEALSQHDPTFFLNQRVIVIADRPLGSHYPDLVYPFSYGFLPGTVSSDGMSVDSYLLGVDKAVEQTEGVVITVVVRARVFREHRQPFLHFIRKSHGSLFSFFAMLSNRSEMC